MTPRVLEALYQPVREDLEALLQLLSEELAADDPFIQELVTHVLRTRGKLLRPALTFLSARAVGEPAAESRALAAAVELIHVASLIHDDVIDESPLRRGEPTANARWGNQVAVLLGDYLFAKSFHLLSRIGRETVASRMSLATVSMSQAEILQIRYGNTPHTEEGIYFRIVEGKTARLIASACACGALLAGAEEAVAERLDRFGLHWGIAFQITDDALDLLSDPETLGKPIGSDIRSGKMTLPLIHALRHARDGDRARLVRLIQEGDVEGLRQELLRYGSFAYAREAARRHAEWALEALRTLPAAPARDSLIGLTEFVLIRDR
ncbi:MAG: polyprenyl synthetase family protein [Armatimonadota bacterium]|nr:polyprenyl synthetase family protein [Armatimonadota bacterium]MDR7614015.1 polyprenyl synthetase family protein [Armatimonadota bacterium]